MQSLKNYFQFSYSVKKNTVYNETKKKNLVSMEVQMMYINIIAYRPDI